MVRVELDSVPIWRNGSEHRPMNRASAMGLEHCGDGEVIRPLLSALLGAGKIADSDPVSVYRGATLCFVEVPVKTWFLRRPQPKQLRKRRAV